MSQELLLSLPDIPRFFTGLAEVLAVAAILVNVPARKRGWPISLVGLGLLQIGAQLLAGTWPISLWVPGMAMAVGLMLLLVFATVEGSLRMQVYLTCKAFILAEFMAALGWQIVSEAFVSQAELTEHPACWHWSLPLMLVIYAACALIYCLVQRFGTKRQPGQSAIYDMGAALTAGMTALMVFTVSNIGFLLHSTSFALGGPLTDCVFRSMVDLCGLFLLGIQERIRNEHQLRDELGVINRVLQTQYDQYKAYKESSDIVRRQFHDLKHQLGVIMTAQSEQQRVCYLSEMVEAINTYSATISTGHPVLDVILTQKNGLAIAEGVGFTCIVDGRHLAFMNPMDISSLFGNALDNALEAVRKIPQAERRLIELRLSRRQDFLVITLQNTVGEPVCFEGEIPRTTKDDPALHGYGLKNIRYIVDKYGGRMGVRQEDEWFVLKMVVPLGAVLT